MSKQESYSWSTRAKVNSLAQAALFFDAPGVLKQTFLQIQKKG